MKEDPSSARPTAADGPGCCKDHVLLPEHLHLPEQPALLREFITLQLKALWLADARHVGVARSLTCIVIWLALDMQLAIGTLRAEVYLQEQRDQAQG